MSFAVRRLAAILILGRGISSVEYVYDFAILLIWTGICVAFVYGVEQIFAHFGYQAKRIDQDRDEDHIPPVPLG